MLLFFFSCSRVSMYRNISRSGMAVLEVKIPTGYFILQTRLDEYVLSGLVPTLRRAKYFHDKVVIYFDYVSNLVSNFLLHDTCNDQTK